MRSSSPIIIRSRKSRTLRISSATASICRARRPRPMPTSSPFAASASWPRRRRSCRPKRPSILPDMDAGCSLEDSCPPDQFAAFRAAHPDHIALTYINCSAAVKALSDIIVTSSSARSHPRPDSEGPEDHLRAGPAPRRLSRAQDRARHAAVAGHLHRPPGVQRDRAVEAQGRASRTRRSRRIPNARRTSSTMPTMSDRPSRSSISR